MLTRARSVTKWRLSGKSGTKSLSTGCIRAVVVVVLAGGIGPAAAQLQIDAAAIRLDYGWGDSLELEAESFELAEGVTTTLAALPIGARAVLLGFPVAPGARADVELVRFDVYAADARIWVVDEEGTREIARSPRVHLLGTVLSNPTVRLGLSVDPDGGGLSGLVSHPAGSFDLFELGADRASGDRPVYEIGTGLAARLGLELSTSCDTPDYPLFFDPSAIAAAVGPVPGGAAPLSKATIAFDTDAEFVNDPQNYNGVPAAANTAIGDWVTNTNVIYERDLGLRLMQGETVLRTVAGAPYVSSSLNIQLDEVGDWWEANKAGVPRVFVALFSGKGPSMGGGCAGAGLAWVDRYCIEQSNNGSYSATQILRCVPLSGSDNVNLAGHEVGHNAGSVHTHCYVPVEVDQCFNAEGGCWSGAVSCPNHTAVIPGITPLKGTVMSYCNFPTVAGGANCGATEPFFHPTVSTLIKQRITANTSATCVMPACSVGVNNLTVTGTDTGTETYSACINLTFGPNYTADGIVTGIAPNIRFDSPTTLGGGFTADGSIP